MSPFLAQVQVFNVAHGTFGIAAPAEPAAPAPPDPPENSETALTEIQANVAKIKAKAKAIVSAAKAEAAANLEKARVDTQKIAAQADADDVKEDSGDTTIRNGTNTVVVHHKKSVDDVAGFVVPCVAIFFVFSWLIVKAVMAPFNQRVAARRVGGPVPTRPGLTDDEQAILLKLQRTLGQMERRIESLETILIDETRTKEKYGTKL